MIVCVCVLRLFSSLSVLLLKSATTTTPRESRARRGR
jgi:hypothetical protein